MSNPLNDLPNIIQVAFNDIFFDGKYIEQGALTADGYGGFTEGSETEHDIKVLIDSFTQMEYNNGISPEHLKAIVIKNTLSVTPVVQDIIQYQNENYLIINWKKDPSTSIYEMEVRKLEDAS